MKAKFLSFFIFLIIFSFSVQSNAEKLFILFDENCMDKLEYKQANNNAYMSFRVNTGGGESLFLEVGTESKKGAGTLPRPFIGCYNGSFDMHLVNRINTHPDEVFIVVPRGRKYYVSPIKHAAFYKNDGDKISYISPKYRFNFSLKNGIINENIAHKNSRVQVYFEGKLDNDCSGVYLFKQVPKGATATYTNLKFVPEIGIIEEAMNATAGNVGKNTLKLSKVNDKKYSRYLKALCAEKIEEDLSFDPTYKADAFEIKPMKPNANPPDMKRKGVETYSSKPAPSKKVEFHTVKKGETLYRIAKKYDISVNQLKSWNGTKSSVIHSGDKLRITESIETTANTADKLTEKSGLVWDKQKSTTSTSASNKSGNHTVKRGETVASIAMKYGYTEARFRQMNGLNKYEVAKTGQKLYTSDCQCPSATSASPATTTVNSFTAKSGATKTGYTARNRSTPNPANVFLRKQSAEPTRTLEPAPYNTRNTFKKSPTTDAYNVKYDPFTATDATRKTAKSAAKPFNNKIQHYDTPVNNSSSYNQSNFYNEPINKVVYPNMQADTGFEKDQLTAKGATPNKKAAPQSYNSTPKKKKVIYQVREGDNLYRIARQYGVSVEHLRQVNNMEVNEIIIPFQKIYIY